MGGCGGGGGRVHTQDVRGGVGTSYTSHPCKIIGTYNSVVGSRSSWGGGGGVVKTNLDQSCEDIQRCIISAM